MSKIDRYYVDGDGHPKSNVVIRDRTSPMSKLTYPTDIAVDLTMGMFKDREQTVELATKICAMLNEAL